MATQKPNMPEEKPVTRQGAGEEEPVRHKGDDRSTPQEKHSGPQPEGNGGTGQPAAFPPHN
ncbi:hypothetical protein HPC49_25995 [Pyxidicoccus fallax]|uniref:Uncharacterized protein n=1 Tax=Pyxidicoccus fallax TaxID=394095 RepID=A0A848LDB6_9BACT|nr:hypothetical protein [Pyxidicoccus fallax]NMO14783.1 hypothetical protein [Pyxidicoccus fallax]NPC81659.1 hypothetical protein [Pyxidicoccus fallax]